MNFRHAIVRTPCRRLSEGLTTADLGPPQYEAALRQHRGYISALQTCGVEVEVLEADERFPDSTFVEDTAVLCEHCAFITIPGAPSRQGEEERVAAALARHFAMITRIQAPGTLDGGDVLRVEDRFFIGLSARTNGEGARQLANALGRFGYIASTVPLQSMLHLKTGISYLGENTVLVSGELAEHEVFRRFRRLTVPPEEAYAANSIRVNDTVIVPAGFPRTAEMVGEAGFRVLAVEVTEFRKVDGGLSCLSLRF